MRQFKIYNMNGQSKTVPGRQFTVEVQGEKYNLFVHAAEGVGSADAVRAVSHVNSGMRVAVVTSSQLQAALRDEVGAARLAFAALVTKAGEARVRSVLAGARDL